MVPITCTAYVMSQTRTLWLESPLIKLVLWKNFTLEFVHVCSLYASYNWSTYGCPTNLDDILMTFEKNDNPLTPFILLLVVEGLGLRICGSYLDGICMGGIKR